MKGANNIPSRVPLRGSGDVWVVGLVKTLVRVRCGPDGPRTCPQIHNRACLSLFARQSSRSRRDELYVVIGERGMTVKRGTTSLAMVSREDMETLLDRSGLSIDRLMGGYDGRPFERDSSVQVFICRKKEVAREP